MIHFCVRIRDRVIGTIRKGGALICLDSFNNLIEGDYICNLFYCKLKLLQVYDSCLNQCPTNEQISLVWKVESI